MLTVAYLANQFPAAVEPYVAQEIEELRRRGTRIISGSVARACLDPDSGKAPDVVLRPVQAAVLLRAIWLYARHWNRVASLVTRVLFHGNEGPILRAKALLHTLLGACYAARLEAHGVDHIHVHHGFSASWIAMVAARLLDVNFSMTLHGSDVLLHRAYLDVKLEHCEFCLTVSEYNRCFILEQYPEIRSGKVILARLGVEVPDSENPERPVRRDPTEPFRMLTVGRLHAVKNHAFLLRACAQLQAQDLDFRCEIAGDGPERHRLESLIRDLGLHRRVTLLGHIRPEQMDSLYRRADVVVLTSRSEGVPLVLMEAMARGKFVLAPAITGIPELVISGKTGFLYEPESASDFLNKVTEIFSAVVNRAQPTANSPDWIRHAARVYVRHNFNRETNLQAFADLFLRRVSPSRNKDLPDASSVLQQI